MAEKFGVIKSETFDSGMGMGKFLEVALKRTTGRFGSVFISLAVGKYDDNGEKKYWKQFTVPRAQAKGVAKLLEEYADIEVKDGD